MGKFRDVRYVDAEALRVARRGMEYGAVAKMVSVATEDERKLIQSLLARVHLNSLANHYWDRDVWREVCLVAMAEVGGKELSTKWTLLTWECSRDEIEEEYEAWTGRPLETD